MKLKEIRRDKKKNCKIHLSPCKMIFTLDIFRFVKKQNKNVRGHTAWIRKLRNVTRMSNLDGPASTYIWFGEKQFLYTETLNNFRYQIYLIEFKTQMFTAQMLVAY